MAELGWKSLGVLELSTLPTLAEEYWVPFVKETATSCLCNGGDAVYLNYWMRRLRTGRICFLHSTTPSGWD